ncbi:uncharacterized protein KY384_008987 [Bacidia gigantensis]|uniref:uncharacterized protein n=1 Tax=Bacidia gigantensis TaxID=2732470 RepID=UPI001D04A15A|nr:uncharacterized protein KY384_008987 [Bacidia gigantensis]KAG8525343.1 hypothetical protein KY384_008987 [Bacidia gigantensis]
MSTFPVLYKMKWTQLRSFLFCFCLVAAQVGVVKADAGFHRDQCYEEVRNILQGNGTSTITHPSMFFSTSDATNPILTLSGCNQLCGSGTGWYPDRIPRLVAWLLPIFLLLSNMQFAPIGLEKFLLILRLLGDPIDSTWSLLAKVDRWGQHHSHAQKLLQDKIEIKSLTMVLAATDEDPHAIDHAFAFDSSANKALILEAAITLRENRKNEVRRTFFAIVLYVFSVLAAFVPAVGAASNPSGGRIGTAMLLSWLLTVVLLSNTVGDFGSPRNRQKILADLMERLGQEKKEETLYKAPGAWSGAIYCYNPRKRFLHGSGWKLALISVPPVAIASGTAFVTLFTGPSHFSCRDVFVVIVFSAWMISAISTSFLSWASFATGKYLCPLAGDQDIRTVDPRFENPAPLDDLESDSLYKIVHITMGAAEWFKNQVEPTPAHFIYLVTSAFLATYALFSSFIRNRLHLSEPPLALLFGIIFGPGLIGLIDPNKWGAEDNITQETARIIVGLQVFAVGVELPKKYFHRHWKSVAMLLGPVMLYSWLITAAFIYAILRTEWTTALIISACLAPTDPILAAAILAESTFSVRVPVRLKHILSAESGCNDGTSFPFLYLGLLFAIHNQTGVAIRDFFLGTILWQCALGLAIGLTIGTCFNKALRLVDRINYIDRAAFLTFYLLLATLSVGIASILGVDDFLVAFGTGYGFAWDGWFRKKMKETEWPAILDLLLNSSMFIYIGSSLPFSHFLSHPDTPNVTLGRLIGLLVLILLLRRIPIVLALKPLIPDIKTYREALFCGHFGPMGVGAIFLVIEARAQLETGTSHPYPHPPGGSPNEAAVQVIWPVVCFVVMGSTFVHGLSVAAIGLGSHFSRRKGGEGAIIGAGEGSFGWDGLW